MIDLLSESDRRQLLDLARRALEARVRRVPPPIAEYGGELAVRHAAFVSIHCRGDLRGCLGHLLLDTPLGQTIVHLAGVVADSDPRFSAVSLNELPDLQVEISVLTSPREIEAVTEIDVGRHGLIVEDGRRRGLLLPQVAVEHLWTREMFLEHTCIKAGLPRNAWQHGARVLVFEAQVFGENQSAGTAAI
jgi:AmmeMemoRadiSam system protein A